MAIVSDIEIRLMANIAQLRQEMDQARQAVGGAMRNITTSVDAAKTALGAIAGVISVGAFAGFIKGAIDATDALNDLSARSSISIKDLSGLAYAAKLSDSSLEGIAGSITKLAQNIGKDEAKFRRLGITASEPLEAFKQLSDIFKNIQDPQQRAAFGAEALGKSWQDSAVLLGLGAKGIGDLVKRGQELSGVNDDVAEQAGKFNDKLDELNAAVGGVGARMAADLLPMLNLLVSNFEDAAKGAGDLGTEFSPLKETFRALVILGGNVVFTFKAVGTEIGAIAAQIGMTGSAIAQAATGDLAGAAQSIKSAFGAGGIGDMAKADGEKARKAFDNWEKGWVEVGTAAAEAKRLAAAPPPAAEDTKAQANAAAKAAAFLKDAENQAKAKKAGEEAAAAAKKNADAYRDLIDSIKLKTQETEREAMGLTKLNDAEKMAADIAIKLAAGKVTLNATQRESVSAMLAAYGANLKAIESQKAYKDMIASLAADEKKLADERAATIKTAEDEAAANEHAAATFGMTKSAIEALSLARLQDQLAQRASLGLTLDEITQLEQLIAIKQRSVGALSRTEELEEAKKAGDELTKFFEGNAAEKFGDTLAKAFGRAGSAMGQLATTFQAYASKQTTFDKQRGAAAQKYLTGLSSEKEYTADIQKLDRQRFSQQLGGYGDMAGAAAGFFNEQSKGYKVMQALSGAFHAAELASTLAELVPKGISAILTQGQGDPYTALPRMAAMAAFVASLGVSAGGGGGSVSVSKQRQATQGTGSVLGDSSAKSESLAKALEMVEDNTYRNLSVNYDMLAALRNIESSLSGLGNLIVRGTGITDLASSVGGTSSGGFWGGIVNSIFGGKVSVLDTGIKIDPTSLAAAMAGGINAMSYVDTKKSGGWFSSDKYRTQTEGLGAEVNTQFSKVIASLADGVKAAGAVLGVAGDDFNQKLSGFVVNIGLISLKDLDGEAIQAELEAAFSKLGDDIANYAVAGLSQFQKVGEGTYETLVRIANDYATVEAVLSSFGKTFGAVGMASIAARENLIDLAGGLDEFTSQGSFFLENFFSDAEKEATLRTAVYAQLDKVSGGSAAQTVAQFKALVLAQDLTTQAGRDAYTSLMSVSQAFIDLTKYSEEAAAKAAELASTRRDLEIQIMDLTGDSVGALAATRQLELDAADDSLKPLYLRIYALQDEATAAEAAAAVVKTLKDNAGAAFSAVQRSITAQKSAAQIAFDELMKGIEASITAAGAKVQDLQSLAQALRTGDTGGTGISRMQAQAQIAAAAAIARVSGVLPTADSLEDALSTIAQDSADQFSSFVDYQRDRLLTSNSVEELAGITDTQLSVAQRTLTALQDQKAATQSAYNAEITRLDGILAAAQQQIDAINGVNTSVLSLQSALQGFASTISAALGNGTIAAQPTASGAASIDAIYQSLLGRGSDTMGLDYYLDLLNKGASLANIEQDIRNSAEYAARTGSIYTPQQSGTMTADSAVVTELQTLNARMANVEAATVKTADSTDQFATQFHQVSAGGNALAVETV